MRSLNLVNLMSQQLIFDSKKDPLLRAVSPMQSLLPFSARHTESGFFLLSMAQNVRFRAYNDSSAEDKAIG